MFTSEPALSGVHDVHYVVDDDSLDSIDLLDASTDTEKTEKPLIHCDVSQKERSMQRIYQKIWTNFYNTSGIPVFPLGVWTWTVSTHVANPLTG